MRGKLPRVEAAAERADLLRRGVAGASTRGLRRRQVLLRAEDGSPAYASRSRVPASYIGANARYRFEFNATGKAAGYRVYWDADGDGWEASDPYGTMQMGGAAGKWAEVDLTVVDTAVPIGSYTAADSLVWSN